MNKELIKNLIRLALSHESRSWSMYEELKQSLNVSTDNIMKEFKRMFYAGELPFRHKKYKNGFFYDLILSLPFGYNLTFRQDRLSSSIKLLLFTSKIDGYRNSIDSTEMLSWDLSDSRRSDLSLTTDESEFEYFMTMFFSHHMHNLLDR